ncbi:MAG: PQQ-dependent sugar dehydrogenase [Chloroflexi bacterium]|nr:PQQ-dependent sugar dehydrogenase [Chloroflexota bacterium]
MAKHLSSPKLANRPHHQPIRKIPQFFAIAGSALTLAASLVTSLTGCSSAPQESLVPTVPLATAFAATEAKPTATATPPPIDAVDRYDFEFVEAFGGYEWERPTDIAFLPDGESALVAEQIGQVHRAFFDARRDPILVFSIKERVSRASNEEGLLSLALDPNYKSNGRVWMYYSVQQGFRSTRLSWFTVDEYIVDWSSEHIVYELSQPFPNHNGGKIVFDNQGHLYLGFGDGGSAADPQDNGQDLSNVYGAIIRLDISASSSQEPYRIPPDNPFLDDTDIPDEIWAYGLRNPWRMSFDPETENLWIGDVGQSHREEINSVNVQTDAGTNFGWNRMEGNACFKPRKGCERAGLTMPIEDYPPRSGNCSVVGGFVYRGASIPTLFGHYTYTDFCKGDFRALDAENWTDGSTSIKPIAPENHEYDNPQVASFGTDNDGEIYALRFNGPILKLVPRR